MQTFPDHCARCPADLRKTSSIMSKFNTDQICPACKTRERAHPDYAAADAAEISAVRAGEMNYPGTGRPADLMHPPCIAEQFVIDADALAPKAVRRLADTLGVFEGPDEWGHEHFTFSDGSSAKIEPMAPASITITRYPSR